MAHVFVTRKIPRSGIALLEEAGHSVDVNPNDAVLSPSELQEALRAKPYEAILSLLTDTIDRAVLDAAPQVRIIANYAVGYDNIDVGAAHTRNIIITNTPDVLTDTVAEYTMALMLAVTKRIVEADAFVRDGKFDGWAPELCLGDDLSGMTLGIIGAGRIGTAAAKRAAHGFSMKVLYTDKQRNEEFEEHTSGRYVAEAEALLRQADVVSLHLPYTPETHHFLNAERLALMKPSGYLINTSRGAVVDEAALTRALTQGALRGAGLDVFEHEPAVTPELKRLQNVVITPHIASASHRTREKMSTIAAQSIIDFFAGKSPKNALS